MNKDRCHPEKDDRNGGDNRGDGDDDVVSISKYEDDGTQIVKYYKGKVTAILYKKTSRV